MNFLNIYACLVHEKQECIIDLVRNLKYLDPESVILLYNGGKDKKLLHTYPFERLGAVVVPNAKTMEWGRLHEFAVECMEFANDNYAFDTITIVDSDQLSINYNYSTFLRKIVAKDSQIGMIGTSEKWFSRNTQEYPPSTAWKEYECWKPWLETFPEFENCFPSWTFWPGTTFTRQACEGIVNTFKKDDEFRELIKKTKIFATEEVILPSLVRLLGFKILATPENHDWIKFRKHYDRSSVQSALGEKNAFWIHPVPRELNNAIREQISDHFNSYIAVSRPAVGESEKERNGSLLISSEIIQKIQSVEGWLSDQEAESLICILQKFGSKFPQLNIIEVGSYQGKATVTMGLTLQDLGIQGQITAIDDSRVGDAPDRIYFDKTTPIKFTKNLRRFNIQNTVEYLRKKTSQVDWHEAIHLLLIDGLHDYRHVSQDFFHFEKYIVNDGVIAFHDCKIAFRGVHSFVEELKQNSNYIFLRKVDSFAYFKKVKSAKTIVMNTNTEIKYKTG